MKMWNITVNVEKEDYIVVRADTERFGKNEIMYEGNTFKECLNYIKRETGQDSLLITGQIVSACRDRNGDVFPAFMRIEY